MAKTTKKNILVIQATLDVSKKKAGGGTVSVECSFVGKLLEIGGWYDSQGVGYKYFQA